jgi:class 3 adenylate cyclase
MPASGEMDEQLSLFARDLARLRRDARRDSALRLAYERYLPSELTEKLLATPGGVSMEGEERDASVLFVDVRGFTGLAETRNPVEVLRFLNRCFGALVGNVRDESGMLDKFLGDGLMAVFGVPFPLEEHALRAVRAANGMQAAIHTIGPQLEADGWGSVSLGIGIESGSVVAGNIGVPERQDYTVVGDVVNVASRLTAGAAPGEIVLGPRTAASVADQYQLISLGAISIRGRRQPVEAFKLP